MANDWNIENLRVQIANPCEPWIGEKIVPYYDCNDNVFVNNVISRENCHNQKIIAWLKPTVDGDKFYNLGESEGNGQESQVICRIIGHCSTTEIRDSISADTFYPIRYITETDFNDKRVYCNCAYNIEDCPRTGDVIDCSDLESCEGNIGGSRCCLTIDKNFEVSDVGIDCRDGKIKRSGSNPIEDLYDSRNVNNISYDDRIGMRQYGTPNNYSGTVFVEYGTEQINYYGDLLPNCITNSPNIIFLYIPCGHYSVGEEYSHQTGKISNGAFSGLTNLRGIWIDDGYYNGSVGGFDYASGDDPFNGCEESLEIVYCPSGWKNYFLQDNIRKFKKLKRINGIPILDDGTTRKIADERTEVSRNEFECD